MCFKGRSMWGRALEAHGSSGHEMRVQVLNWILHRGTCPVGGKLQVPAS